jgi:hypothetical protein
LRACICIILCARVGKFSVFPTAVIVQLCLPGWSALQMSIPTSGSTLGRCGRSGGPISQFPQWVAAMWLCLPSAHMSLGCPLFPGWDALTPRPLLMFCNVLLAAKQVHKAAVGRVHPDRGLGLRFPRFLRIRQAIQLVHHTGRHSGRRSGRISSSSQPPAECRSHSLHVMTSASQMPTVLIWHAACCCLLVQGRQRNRGCHISGPGGADVPGADAQGGDGGPAPGGGQAAAAAGRRAAGSSAGRSGGSRARFRCGEPCIV